MDRLSEAKQETIKNCEEEIAKLTKLISDCEEVKQYVTALPEKLSHNMMVKLGPCAFVPGNLVHSNELTLLLGDGWCADITAKQAADYMERKLQRYKNTLEHFEKEKENHEMWAKFIHGFAEEDECIREEVNDNVPTPHVPTSSRRIPYVKKDNFPEDLDEKRLRVLEKNKEDLKESTHDDMQDNLESLRAKFNAIQMENAQQNPDNSDLDAMYDTEELTETEEESEDEDLADENEEDDVPKNSDIIKLDSDQLNKNISENHDENHQTTDDQPGDKHDKHVRWIDLSEAKSKCITFTHSKSPSVPHQHHKRKNKRRRRSSSTSEVSEEEHEEKNGFLINSPSDIYKCFSYSFQQPKSILKSSSTETVMLNDEFRDLIIDQNKNTSFEEENEHTELEKNVNNISVDEVQQTVAFTGEVQEHFENSSVEKITISERPRSLFKSSR